MTAAMGWNSDGQLGTYATVTDSNLRSIADSLVSTGLAALGYTQFEISTHWWDGNRDSGGNIVVPVAQFPSANGGIAGTVAYLKSKGFRPGTYTDGGNTGCGVPGGSYGHYQQDVSQFAAWGFQFFDLDACGLRSQGLNPKAVHTQVGTYAAQYGLTWRADDGCNFVGAAGAYAGIEGQQCPSDDASANPNWEYGPYTATLFRVYQDGTTAPYSCSIQTIGSCTNWAWTAEMIQYFMKHPGAHFPGHWADAEFLQMGRGITDVEAQSEYSMICMMSGPLMMALQPASYTGPQIAILSNPEVIAIDQDPLQSMAVWATTPTANTQVWVKRLQSGRAVALYNLDSVAHDITFSAADAGLSGTFAVRDLWAKSDLGTFSSYTATAVPSHAVILLKLTNVTEANATTVQVNVGGGASGAWVADTNVAAKIDAGLGTSGLTGDGTVWTTANAIDTSLVTTPAPTAVYQSGRQGIGSGSTPYNAALETYIPRLALNGCYQWRLHFIEPFKTAAGQRRFNIRVNNQLVAANFDIYSQAGAQFKAVALSGTTQAPQGSVSVDLSTGAADYPIISGVEVTQVGC